MIVSIGFKAIGLRELNTSPESSDSRTSPVTAPPLTTCRGLRNRTKFASLVHFHPTLNSTPAALPFGNSKPASMSFGTCTSLPGTLALAPRCPALGISFSLPCPSANTSLPCLWHRHAAFHGTPHHDPANSTPRPCQKRKIGKCTFCVAGTGYRKILTNSLQGV